MLYVESTHFVITAPLLTVIYELSDMRITLSSSGTGNLETLQGLYSSSADIFELKAGDYVSRRSALAQIDTIF